MKHEKLFTRENGIQYLIQISFINDSIMETFEYRTNVLTRAKGKRNWDNIETDIDEWSLRKLTWEQKAAYHYNNSLRFVSESEIMEVKTELWNRLKPL
jgi:hypothetical protein